MVAVAVSEDLRNKVLDTLFGKEEEFDYTSTTTNNTPPSVPKTEDEDNDSVDSNADVVFDEKYRVVSPTERGIDRVEYGL